AAPPDLRSASGRARRNQRARRRIAPRMPQSRHVAPSLDLPLSGQHPPASTTKYQESAMPELGEDAAAFEVVGKGIYLEGLAADYARDIVWYSDVIAGGIHGMGREGP